MALAGAFAQQQVREASQRPRGPDIRETSEHSAITAATFESEGQHALIKEETRETALAFRRMCWSA